MSKEWFRSCPKGPANSATVLAVALEIAAGMSYLHDRGIVHGDLSSGEPPCRSACANIVIIRATMC